MIVATLILPKVHGWSGFSKGNSARMGGSFIGEYAFYVIEFYYVKQQNLGC